MKRIGILGGTFDPPHIGHLFIADEVRIRLRLQEVWFIPSYQPPHKREAKTSVNDRIQMISRAINDHSAFKLNTIEINRLEKSYTFDTMKALTEDFPHKKFYFIIGADMVEYLPHWRNIDALMKLVTFVGVKRPGYQLQTSYPIIEMDIPYLDISSTLIRKRLRNKQSVRYLMPQSVYAYIKEKQLYEY